MDDGNAIECRGVSKLYRRPSRKRKFQTLKSAILGGDLFRGLSAGDAIHALDPIDLIVPKGQSIGIVGGNGSGKSTLMKMIYGTTKPTTGTIETAGRVSALIELGAGFHPEITGRENVAINGIMLGLGRKEIQRRFQEIVEFAEIADFIDAPVKTYSSGMYARLGFAVAISVKPDILLIDEILAVGDESFSHKCVERIRLLQAEGRTVVMVTHDLAIVEKLCDRAVWLKQGKLMDDGEPRRVIDAYRMDVARHEEERLTAEHESTQQALSAPMASAPVPPTDGGAVEEPKLERWGSGDVEITSVTISGADGAPRHLFSCGEALSIKLAVVPRKRVEDFVFGIGIFSEDGTCVYGTNTHIERFAPVALDGPGEVVFAVEALDLVEGTYRLDIAVHSETGAPYDYQRGLYTFRVTSDVKDIGLYRPRHRWRFAAGVKLDAPES